MKILLETCPSVLLETGSERVRLRPENGRSVYKDVEIALSPASDGLDVELTASGTPVKRVYLTWEFAAPENAKVYSDAWERGYGDLEWRGVVPERAMPWYTLINHAGGTYGFGVKTGANAMCWWKLDGYSITLCLDVRNGAQGVVLSGRTLKAAKAVFMSAGPEKSAFEAARDFCRTMCGEPRLPRGYVFGSNNWYYAYGNISHAQVLKDAELLKELAGDIPVRPYLVIDDGWQVSRTPSYNGGPWHSGNADFPDMEKLASEIKARGLRPGLWYRPLVTVEQVPEEWRLRRVKDERFSVLDPSHPQALAKIEDMTRTLVRWGYELLKHDFTTYDVFGRWGPYMGASLTDEGWGFYDKSRTTAEIILDMYRVIRRGAGDDTVIIGCNTLSHLSAGLFELQRTGDDTSGRQWERTRKMGVNTLAFRMPQHGAFYLCDADCAGVTEYIDWKLNREWLNLLAESGTPLFVSIDPDTATLEQKQDVAQAFRTACGVKEPSEPLSWLSTTCPDLWRTEKGVQRFHFPSMPDE